MRSKQLHNIVFGVALSILVVSANPVAAQTDITLSLTRNLGLGLGGIIQGTFTLSASGAGEIQNMTVYFNGDEVYFSEGSTFSWQFATDDYTSGATNITVIGIDDSGTVFTGSLSVTFLGGIGFNLIIFGIIALTIILVIAKYGPILMRRKSS